MTAAAAPLCRRYALPLRAAGAVMISALAHTPPQRNNLLPSRHDASAHAVRVGWPGARRRARLDHHGARGVLMVVGARNARLAHDDNGRLGLVVVVVVVRHGVHVAGRPAAHGGDVAAGADDLGRGWGVRWGASWSQRLAVCWAVCWAALAARWAALAVGGPVLREACAQRRGRASPATHGGLRHFALLWTTFERWGVAVCCCGGVRGALCRTCAFWRTGTADGGSR